MKRLLAILVLLMGLATPAQAQFDGPRVDHPLVKLTNVLSATYVDADANAAFTVLNNLQADVGINSSTTTLGFTKSLPIFGRTAHWQFLMPVGTLDTDVPFPLTTNRTSAKGIGDLTLGATVNILGAPVLPVREALRYDLKFNVSIGASVTAPTGSYDEGEGLNLGSNQWSVRLAAPIVKSLGDWVPGRRTTFEVKPAVRVFGNNPDSNPGNTIEQDPMYSVEAHLTRDLMKDLFVSLDYSLISGGDQTHINNATQAVVTERDFGTTHLLGATLSFRLSDNARLYLNHMQTLGGDRDRIRLDAALSRIQLVWAWHPVLEERRRFLD